MTTHNITPTGTVTPLNLSVTFLGFLDTHMLIPVIALYADSLGSGLLGTGLIVGLYSVTNTPANIIFGRLIDRFGNRRPLIAGLLGDGISMFFYSACRFPWHLAFLRAFHGIAGGLVGPATLSITTTHAAPDRKGKAMGFYGMAIGTATLVGYSLSGTLVSVSGYNVVFYTGTLLLMVGVVLAWLMPRDGNISSTRSEATVHSSLRNIAPLVRRKGLSAAYSAIFTFYITFGGVVTLLPIYVKGLGMNAFHVGMSLAAFSFVFILLQLASGSFSDRIGRKLPMTAGLCLTAIIIMVLLPASQTFVALLAVMALYGAAYALIFPSASAMIADHTSAGEYGIASGMFHALLTAGVAIGAPLIGWIAGETSIGLGLIVSGGLAILAAIVVLLRA